MQAALYSQPNGIRRATAAPAFAGVLDDYTTDLFGLHATCQKLLASYEGPLIKIRRSSDDATLDIGAKDDGWLDEVALAAFVGVSDWFIDIVYDQSGNGNDIHAPSAASQPQGAFDANGRAYGYAPGAGFTTTMLASGALATAFEDSTVLSVHSSAGYMLDCGTMRADDTTERRINNFSNSIQTANPSAGTEATLAGTDTRAYSLTFQVGSSGHRLSIGASTATGTKTSDAKTLAVIAFGSGGGGPTWAQNSKFYCCGFWLADLGDTVTDEIQAIGETLLVP